MEFQDQSLYNVLQKLINQTGAAEGTNLPPNQVGDVRVPIISSLRLGPVSQVVGATQFVLMWDEPENIPPGAISAYRIYATQITATGAAQTAPITAHTSPTTIQVQVSANTALIFTVQTVLANGLVSDPLNSPSVSYFATAPGWIEIASPVANVPGAPGAPAGFVKIVLGGITYGLPYYV